MAMKPKRGDDPHGSRADYIIKQPGLSWNIVRSGRAWALLVLLFGGLFLVGLALEHLGWLPGSAQNPSDVQLPISRALVR